VRARPAHRPRGSGQAVRGRAAGPIEPSAAVAGASARPRALPESLGLSTTAQFDKVAGGYRPEQQCLAQNALWVFVAVLLVGLRFPTGV